RGGLGMAVLLGAGQKDYMENLAAFADIISGKANPNQQAYNRSLETAGVQLGILGNHVQAAAILLGSNFESALAKTVSALTVVFDLTVKVGGAILTVLRPALDVIGFAGNLIGTTFNEIGTTLDRAGLHMSSFAEGAQSDMQDVALSVHSGTADARRDLTDFSTAALLYGADSGDHRTGGV